MNVNDVDIEVFGMAQKSPHARILTIKAPRTMAALNPITRVTTSWWLDASRDGFTNLASSKTHGQMTSWGGVGSGIMKR